MGDAVRTPPASDSTDDEEPQSRLGDVLSGRFADTDIDSVAAVREERKP